MVSGLKRFAIPGEGPFVLLRVISSIVHRKPAAYQVCAAHLDFIIIAYRGVLCK
jgi:hypothetical protein